MSQYGGSSLGFFLAGGYDLRAQSIQSLDYEKKSILARNDGLGDSAETLVPVGMMQYTLAQNGGIFNSVANSAHDLMKTGSNVYRVISFGVAGNTVGAPFVGCLGVLGVTYKAQISNGALTAADATYAISGRCYDGEIVQPWATKTADWNTDTLNTVVDYTTVPQTVIPITSNTLANPTVVTTPVAHGLTTGQVILISGVATSDPTINGQQTVTVISTTTFSVAVNVTTAGTGGSFVLASTVNGGYGFQQVSAFSGFSGFVGTLQHSVDDSTYVTLGAFTNVTSGPTAETITVAGTVRRYVAFDGNVTGSGSITMMAGFARA